jgi:hypothetical protein
MLKKEKPTKRYRDYKTFKQAEYNFIKRKELDRLDAKAIKDLAVKIIRRNKKVGKTKNKNNGNTN